MKPLSRSEFLRLAGASAAGAYLIGPGVFDLSEAGAATYPHMTVAHGTNTTAIVTKAIAGLGGMSRFVTKGDHVVIKPNICVDYRSSAYAATTNPTVVATLVKLCTSAGAASVRVMDRPFGGTAPTAYKVSGIGPAVAKAGGKMVVMSPTGYAKYSIPKGKWLHSWSFYKEMIQADVLIDVPIAKVHGSSRLTIAGKNLMGCIDDMGKLHPNLSQGIADIASLLKPDLTVVDAVRILVKNGPTGGSLSYVKRKNLVIASPDIVAADAYAATLFGLRGADVPYIKAMAASGLGTMKLASITIKKYNL